MPEPMRLKEPMQVSGDAGVDLLIAQSHRKPVLLEFWMEGCVHCRLMAPSVRVIAGEYESRMDVAAYRIDAITRSVKRFQVRGTPTFLLLDKGKVVWRAQGAIPLGKMRADLDQALAGLGATTEPHLT